MKKTYGGNMTKLYRIIDMLSRSQLLNWMSDSVYLKIRFRIKTGYKLNLDNPKTFNEKLQWLKINYHDPAFIQMVDKNAVKNIIRNTYRSTILHFFW